MVRLMSIEDYDQVYALWISTPGMGLNGVDDTREGIARFLMRNPSTCFVAEVDSMIAGTILCGHDGRRGYIYHTAVVPIHRKKGIGHQLVENAMEALKAEGITKVALVVFSRNETGNMFWAQLGFDSREDLIYRNKRLITLERIDP